MTVTDTILGFIADIGLNAAKGRYKITRDELQARVKLTDYLARQQKYNFNCSLEEEIDFEGLAEYIRSNLMDEDIKAGDYLGCHPCINTSSLKLRTADVLETFLPAVHHEPIFVHLTGE